MWPKKVTFCCRNWYLDGCTFSPACLRCSNTSCRLDMCSSKVLPTIIISSLYTRKLIHCSPASTEFISLWKVAGVLQRPKGITLNSNKPSCVQNTIFSRCPPATSTYQYPLFRSRVVNQAEPASVSSVSSILGIG